jgi:pyruvate dehydrogenase E2 component (dihydrolipoamide acetyltransferase)
MKIDLVMPKMGESLTEGTIIKWLKKEGDSVERDEMILEISTDKVDTEVPAPNAGILTKILAQENETVEVGKVIAIIDTEESETKPQEGHFKEPVQKEEEEVEEKTTKDTELAGSSGDLTDIVMPKMGESLTEGTILKWLKKPGDKVERDEMILEISTDKVDTEVPSSVAGTLVEVLYNENDVVKVGEVIAKIAAGDETPFKQTPQKTEKRKDDKPRPEKQQEEVLNKDIKGDATEIPHSKDGRFYSPLVRSIAEKENISLGELESINGTGVDGRVTKNDVLEYLEKKKSGTPAKEQKVEKAPETEKEQRAPVKTEQRKISVGSDKEVIPMDRIRQLIAEHMVYSKRTSAHVTSFAEADVTGLVKFREAEKNAFLKREGFKLTYTPFFAKAIVDGLKQFPMVNVSVDEKNIIVHRRINLGIATALEDGNLIVPVVRNADDLGVTGLARQIYDLSTRARSKNLNPDDIQGGTISLTNVGTFGTLFGTPIINQPQAAIIGVGAIKKRPIVQEVNGEDHIVVRHMMYATITYDHRVVDGMLAGQCLMTIVKSLEGMNKDTIKL